MANYSTQLKTWGAAGQEYPDNYGYVEGEQPVDAWDNFFNSNVIQDVEHLISLTNDRIESDKGAAGSEPASPEESHLYHDQGNDRLRLWDGGDGVWRDLATENWALTNVAVGATDDGTAIADPITSINFGNNLSASDDGDGTITVDGVAGDNQFASVVFDDADGDGSKYSLTENSTSGDFVVEHGGAIRHELTQNGDLRIGGELTETAAL